MPHGAVVVNLSYGARDPSLPEETVVELQRRTDYVLVDKIAWKKPRAMPFQASATRLARIWEALYVFCRRGHEHSFTTNKRLTKRSTTGQRCYGNVWNYVEAANNNGGGSRVRHMKAAFSSELVRWLLDVYFPLGAVVLDPFCGSGTVPLACAQTGRHHVGIELERSLVLHARRRVTAAPTVADAVPGDATA